jgi:uncharacterized protein (TIGR03435 family)
VAAKSGPKLKEAACVGQPSFDNLCGGFRMAPGGLMGRVVSTAQLAGDLSRLLSRTVLDRTDMTGKYDLDLKWTPDERTLRDPNVPPPDPNGPSIFTALQEQLGLELKSTKGPVEMLVIDHIEKPDPN